MVKRSRLPALAFTLASALASALAAALTGPGTGTIVHKTGCTVAGQKLIVLACTHWLVVPDCASVNAGKDSNCSSVCMNVVAFLL